MRDSKAPDRTVLWFTIALAALSTAIIPINFYLFATSKDPVSVGFVVLAGLQFVTGVIAGTCGILYAVRKGTVGGTKATSIVFAVVGMLVGIGGPIGLFLAFMAEAIAFGGGAWGRPLRVRGRILHPSLRVGSDWTRGARPDVHALDAPTRAALEALWLHDAQKEHASVPAFARISWQLAAIGAPADLLVRAHDAALEEIDHARRCFALAAGYGGRSHTAEPMPDLLLGGLDTKGDPLVAMATESLRDGCLLEDFNADVAAACERACEDVATKDVLARIAREERSHADFSWALLAWLVERGGARVRRAIAREAERLGGVPRPTAVSREKAALVEKADAAKMRAHGRIADEEWAALWTVRVAEATARARALVERAPGSVAA